MSVSSLRQRCCSRKPERANGLDAVLRLDLEGALGAVVRQLQPDLHGPLDGVLQVSPGLSSEMDGDGPLHRIRNDPLEWEVIGLDLGSEGRGQKTGRHEPAFVTAVEAVEERGPFGARNLSSSHGVSFTLRTELFREPRLPSTFSPRTVVIVG